MASSTATSSAANIAGRMRTWRCAANPLAWILLTGLGPAMLHSAPAHPPEPESPLIRQVDHILIASSHPRELFAFLSETLELPVAWPLSSYGRFVSGGVAAGNVNLEVLARPGPADAPPQAIYVGLALEPVDLPATLTGLAARHIRHGAPAPFRSRAPDGTWSTRWTTVALPEVSSDGLEVFLCEYGHDEDARRQRLQAALHARGGGPLAVLAVREIVVGTRQDDQPWRRLLHPVPDANGRWPIGTGPALRVQTGPADAIQGLVLTVRALEPARQFLREHAVPGNDGSDAIVLRDPRLQGLNLTLVAAPADAP